jgi:hypothetical protein
VLFDVPQKVRVHFLWRGLTVQDPRVVVTQETAPAVERDAADHVFAVEDGDFARVEIPHVQFVADDELQAPFGDLVTKLLRDPLGLDFLQSFFAPLLPTRLQRHESVFVVVVDAFEVDGERFRKRFDLDLHVAPPQADMHVAIFRAIEIVRLRHREHDEHVSIDAHDPSLFETKQRHHRLTHVRIRLEDEHEWQAETRSTSEDPLNELLGNHDKFPLWFERFPKLERH